MRHGIMSSPSKHSNLGQARSQARSRSLSPFEEEPPARGLTIQASSSHDQKFTFAIADS